MLDGNNIVLGCCRSMREMVQLVLGEVRCSQDLRVQTPCAMIEHLCTLPLKYKMNLSLRTSCSMLDFKSALEI